MTKVSSLAFALLFITSLILAPRQAFCEEAEHDAGHRTEGLMRGER
ncbi:MAG: hypothetical protein IMY68_11835, partial [Bacteroidetes bacterium]|nr:hypothetical protein [Bacteroidota bacterium]